jgi:hypothetical protein
MSSFKDVRLAWIKFTLHAFDNPITIGYFHFSFQRGNGYFAIKEQPTIYICVLLSKPIHNSVIAKFSLIFYCFNNYRLLSKFHISALVATLFID